MTNIAIFKSLIDRYTKVAYAHNYIWGFTYKHNVYMAVTDASYVETLCCLDKASRGEGWALRFRPNSAQKLAILPNSKLLCSEDFFMETVQGCVYNKGEVFEKLYKIGIPFAMLINFQGIFVCNSSRSGRCVAYLTKF